MTGFKTLLAGLLLLATAAGCSDDPLESTEVKTIQDRIAPEELQAFLNVVETLPHRKLPRLPALFLPPPNWSASRSLPVNELIQEERKTLAEHASVDWLTRHLPKTKEFQRALRKERLTPQQFVGLAIALGLALSRTEIGSQDELEKIIARGVAAVALLEKDKRVFNTLSEDVAYHTLEQAGWISLMDRLLKLKQVPQDNQELVRTHGENLRKALPDEFLYSPLKGFGKLLENDTLPFSDPGGANPDDHIFWSRETALLGPERSAAHHSSHGTPLPPVKSQATLPVAEVPPPFIAPPGSSLGGTGSATANILAPSMLPEEKSPPLRGRRKLPSIPVPSLSIPTATPAPLLATPPDHTPGN